MSTEIKEVSKEKREPTTVKEHINSEAFREKLRVALPKHLTPERFAGVALTQINTNPGLLNCTQESLFKCLLQLGQMGLEPDGRRAHLVPYGTECTLLIDYKAWLSWPSAMETFARIHADVVYESRLRRGISSTIGARLRSTTSPLCPIGARWLRLMPRWSSSTDQPRPR